jgi:arylsulfatase A-like enzyme
LEKFKKKAAQLPQPGPEDQKEHDGLTKMRQDNPEYASMVYAMDENVGRVLNRLEELGLDENTIVVFTSDNGGLSTRGRRGFPTCNLPLRAGKGWCYEGGIRVPFIIRAPGVTKEGSVCSEPVVSNDFYPTLLELAGYKSMPSQHQDGQSLLPLLKQTGGLKRDALYWHYPHYHGSTWTPGAAIRAGDWKLIEFYHYDKVELYNLKEDIGEQNEVSKSNPAKTAELRKKLHEWQDAMNAKMPKPNPNEKQSSKGEK